MESVRGIESLIGKNSTVVVDSAMQVVKIIPTEKAITKIVSNKAYTLLGRAERKLVRSPSVSVEMPLVIGLFTYAGVQNAKSSGNLRMSIFKRDKRTCCYCGKPGNTLDHIVPKSRGGKNTWTNLCVACKKCNGKKRNLTPTEAGLDWPVIQGETLNLAIQDLFYKSIYE